MRCPKCNSPVSFKQKRCESCGEDLKTYKKIISASNCFYNDGLTRAKVRDLSGAEVSLKKSLELDKTNTDARNLLGLVYNEMGETVNALSQWVISKHFQAEDNAADGYMKELQENPAALETINQTIKKYNQALQLAKEGNEDLAAIQLRKVTSLNPKFVQAQQLLALLYIKSGEKEKAVKCLKKAEKVDINNIATIRYLNEVTDGTQEESLKEEKHVHHEKKQVKEKAVMPSFDKFQDNGPNIWVFLNLIIGAVIGIAFVYVLIVPTVKKNVAADYKDKISASSDLSTSKDAKIESLQSKIDELNNQLDEKDKDIQNLKDSMIDETDYDNLFDAVELYQQGKYADAAGKLVDVDGDKLTSGKAKDYYNTIKEATFESGSTTLYNDGKNKYNVGNYDEAIPLFEKALKLNDQNVDALYFLGRAYDRKGDTDKAKKYYNKVISDFPDSGRATEATQKLSFLGA